VLVAAVQQQASQLDAFVARPALPVAFATSPRDKDKEKDDEAAPAQCLAIGASAPSRIPLAVIRPAFDWWR
jgi:hypothetical protein